MSAPVPDETQDITIEQARALPGLLGIIAAAMLAKHGTYGFTDGGRTILLRLVRADQAAQEVHP